MRPLYIEGRVGCRVVYDEPALRVMFDDKADQLFPVPRISRVVCSGIVDWSISALMACADAGVNVVFLTKSGEIRARWLGQCQQRQGLAQRLIDLLARADGPASYQNWYLAIEKLAARSFARRLGFRDWREISVVDLKQYVARYLSKDQLYCANLLKSILYSELLIWLANSELSGDDENLVSSFIDLPEDFSRLLMWDFYPILLNHQLTQADLHNAAWFFDQQHDRFYLLFRSTLNKLHQFLLALN